MAEVSFRITNEQINAVLRAVIAQERNNPHAQLTILTRALVRAAKVIGSDVSVVTINLAQAWDEEPEPTTPRRMQ